MTVAPDGETRRESSDALGTRREDVSAGVTRRDGGDPTATRIDGRPSSGAYVRVNLPPELVDRFEVMGEIGSGGESDVLLVRERAAGPAGPRLALKIYRHGLRPDETALERIRNLPAAHVVPILDSGPSTAGWWEAQEYIENGSVADLLQHEGPRLAGERLLELIRELTAALEAVHPVLHRDVKPTNVLVRSTAPLDLVLSDFGLARSTAFTHIVSRVAGSLAYQSPEALDGGASPARDWWAVGMIVAEAALGRHPFDEPGLGMPSTAEIRIALTTRPVPLDGLADDRLRLLCRGLLTRDPRHRWGANQIHGLLAGETPPVADQAMPARARQIQPFVFAGVRVEAPEALAPVLAENWEVALRLISGAASSAPDYVRLVVWLEEHEHEHALRVLQGGAQDRSFARRLFRLLRVLDPALPPTFRGQIVDRDGLLGLAERAAAGSVGDCATLYDLEQLALIGELAREDRFDELIGVDEHWRRQMELLTQLRGELGAAGRPLDDDAIVRAVRGRLLTMVLDPDAADRMRAEVGQPTQPALVADATHRDLFTRVLGTGDEPARLVAALLALEPAREQYERALGERRAAEAAERATREAAAEEERERRLGRVRSRDRAIVLATLVALGSVVGPAQLGLVLSGSGPLQDPGASLLRVAGLPVPLMNAGYVATGSLLILAAGSALLSLRARVRETPLGALSLAVFAIAAGVVALLLPSLRDRAWQSSLGRLAVPNAEAPCTPAEGAAFRLPTGTLQPVVVGAPPRCQLVWRLAGRRGRTIWAKWVPRMRVLRIHRFPDALVVAGTYGGRRVAASGSERTRGSRLVVVSLAPRTGRELWRRACPAPADGERGVLFHAGGVARNGIRRYVRLRCGDGRLIFLRTDGRQFGKARRVARARRS